MYITRTESTLCTLNRETGILPLALTPNYEFNIIFTIEKRCQCSIFYRLLWRRSIEFNVKFIAEEIFSHTVTVTHNHSHTNTNTHTPTPTHKHTVTYAHSHTRSLTLLSSSEKYKLFVRLVWDKHIYI